MSFLIIEFYTRDNDIEYIEHDCVERLIDQYLDSANCFEDILDQIESIKVENMSKKYKANLSNYQFHLFKTNGFSKI